jgi:hypothetical protein
VDDSNLKFSNPSFDSPEPSGSQVGTATDLNESREVSRHVSPIPVKGSRFQPPWVIPRCFDRLVATVERMRRHWETHAGRAGLACVEFQSSTWQYNARTGVPMMLEYLLDRHCLHHQIL